MISDLWYTAAFVFAMGAIVGSFLNVCIYRLPKRASIVAPRSFCPSCKKSIGWYDNIPLVSYAILRGKCRSCKSGISPVYIIVEFLTGALFLALFLTFGLTPEFFIYSVFTCGLVIATFVDFEIQEIPDEISLGGIALGLVLSFAFPSIMDQGSRLQALFQSFIGVVVGGGMIYLLGLTGEAIFKKEAMGGGDVKLLAMIGAFLGWKFTVLTFFMAPIFGSFVGIIMKYRYGKETIPYGPYLSVGALGALFFGEKIISFLSCGIY
ncbi:MAG: prepilin peptidase [Candidatus Omnitrophota bacterium]|jgi:leader peptidase (prepilin peptidase)/N-methyltransferase